MREKIGKKALIKLMKDTLRLTDELRAKEKESLNASLARAAAESLDKLIIKLPEHEDCDHGVTFDYEAAKGLSAPEVKARWPRGYGQCPKGCGYVGIAYASYEHYICGDW